MRETPFFINENKVAILPEFVIEFSRASLLKYPYLLILLAFESITVDEESINQYTKTFQMITFKIFNIQQLDSSDYETWKDVNIQSIKNSKDDLRKYKDSFAKIIKNSKFKYIDISNKEYQKDHNNNLYTNVNQIQIHDLNNQNLHFEAKIKTNDKFFQKEFFENKKTESMTNLWPFNNDNRFSRNASNMLLTSEEDIFLSYGKMTHIILLFANLYQRLEIVWDICEQLSQHDPNNNILKIFYNIRDLFFASIFLVHDTDDFKVSYLETFFCEIFCDLGPLIHNISSLSIHIVWCGESNYCRVKSS